MTPLVAVLGSLLLGVAVAAIHHEFLEFLTRAFLPSVVRPRRWHVGATVAILLVAHVAEIVVYALGMYLVGTWTSTGALVAGLPDESLARFDTWVYFSFSCYTSLGIGDLQPIGSLRLLAGTEALVGLVMIGWTASFLLLEMRELWSIER